MAGTFSLPEVRDELVLLGHDDVPDHVILEILSQTQHYSPWSAADPLTHTSRASGNDSSPPPTIRRSMSSREVHGRPVPGDRDFRRSNHRIESCSRGGLDSLCFTPDFATEVDEMRKMLRIMQGTKEQIFGSRNARNSLKKAMGLADEHEQYVGKLFSEWRVVGKVLRCKQKEKHEEDESTSVFGVDNAVKSENSLPNEILEEFDHVPVSELKRTKSKEMNSFGRQARSAGINDDDWQTGCEDIVEDAQVVKEKAKGKLLAQSNGETSTNSSDRTVVDDENTNELARARSNETEDYGRGGMRTIDKFEDRRRLSVGSEEIQSEGGDYISEAESSNTHEGGDLSTYGSPKSLHSQKQEACSSPAVDEHSAVPNNMDSETSSKALDAEETRDRVGLFKGNRHSGSSKPPSLIPLVIPIERENPDGNPFLRTPDQRSLSEHHSPFNDRSNIPTGNDQRRNRRLAGEGHPRPKPAPWISGLNTPEKSPKRVLSFDSRRREGPEFRAQGPSDVPEDLLDRMLAKSPSSSIRRPGKPLLKSNSEKYDVRLPTPRSKAANDTAKAAGDSSKALKDSSDHLDLPSFHALSPLKVDKACGVLESARHSSCTVCAARRISGESSPALPKSGSRSPFGGASSPLPPSKTANRIPVNANAPEASPKHSTMKKSSGLYTPISRETRKPNIVLKTSVSRPITADTTDSDRPVIRRQSSMRLSAESSAVQGSSNDSRSGLESPSLTRSSTSLNERRTPKDKLTPGGPRRGGKVDRVARFAEMQNLWKSDKFLKACGKRKSQSFHRIFSELHKSHERFYAAFRERVLDATRQNFEQPPFVVPHSNSYRIRSPRGFPSSVI